LKILNAWILHDNRQKCLNILIIDFSKMCYIVCAHIKFWIYHNDSNIMLTQILYFVQLLHNHQIHFFLAGIVIFFLSSWRVSTFNIMHTSKLFDIITYCDIPKYAIYLTSCLLPRCFQDIWLRLDSYIILFQVGPRTTTSYIILI